VVNEQGGDYHLYMIEYCGKKVGAAWVEQILPRIASAELGILIGEPQLWGLGIGTQAMQAMMEIAKNRLGLKFLWLSVREANVRAVTCYKKCGFIVKKRTPVINKLDGSYQIWVAMERML
jgi:RimJ/RimL family protein N-acetyltransferase